MSTDEKCKVCGKRVERPITLYELPPPGNENPHFESSLVEVCSEECARALESKGWARVK